MKRIITILFAALIICGTASAQAEWACLARYSEANKALTVAPKAVFYGDSITDGWAYADKDFFASNNFAGRGISGTVTAQMLVRMRQDVINLHPKYMVFLGGINDIAQNQGPIEVEDTFNNIVSMIQLAKANKIKPVICLLFPVDVIAWRPQLGNVSDKVKKLNSLLVEYCKANKVTVVDYFSEVATPQWRMPESLSNDSVHPNMDGYKIMEEKILKVLK